MAKNKTKCSRRHTDASAGIKQCQWGSPNGKEDGFLQCGLEKDHCGEHQPSHLLQQIWILRQEWAAKLIEYYRVKANYYDKLLKNWLKHE